MAAGCGCDTVLKATAQRHDRGDALEERLQDVWCHQLDEDGPTNRVLV